MKKQKIAVILFNLGGPTDKAHVKPFLFNLFNDSAIISLPQPFRYLLAKIISGRRHKQASKIYEHIGGKSPLLENTKKQGVALEKKLNASGSDSFKVFSAMRYWHPFTEEACKDVKDYNPDEIILLSLYPQFSMTTTKSSFQHWSKIAKKTNLTANTKAICCYYDHPLFIKSHCELIEKEYKKIKTNREIKILFSAHGIPINRIQAGDPYQDQITKSATLIANQLKIPDLNYEICYQSKVGPLQWLSPSIDVALKSAIKDDLAVLIVPIAFVSEHSETLVELDIEYKEMFLESGNQDFYRVEALGCNKAFISALSEVCLKSLLDISPKKIDSFCQSKCDKMFGQCMQGQDII